MNVFMIGGTGLLGAKAAEILIMRGHTVSSVALPPLPQGAPLPKEMNIELCNLYEKSDEEIREMELESQLGAAKESSLTDSLTGVT